LLCNECERSGHVGHEVIPLKGFLEKLEYQKHCTEVETITVDCVDRIKETQKKWAELLR